MLKRCCVLMQNLVFLDWRSFEHLSLIFLIFLLSSRMNQEALDAACPALLARQTQALGTGVGLLGSREQAAGAMQQETALGADPCPQPGTPESHLEPAATGHEGSPCKMTTFIKTAYMCLEQVLNITQYWRAAGEATEIPVTSPEIQGTARQASAAPRTPPSSNIGRSATTRSSV